MTQPPPEWTEHRSDTQRTADDIATACRSIRRDWPHLIRPGDTQPPGAAARHALSTYHRPDADEDTPEHDVDQSYDDGRLGASDADTRRIDKAISYSRHVRDSLNTTSRIIMEDRPVTNSEAIPYGQDVAGMCDFIALHADWISGQDVADEIRDEMRALARGCQHIVNPARRDIMRLGTCPCEVPGELDVLGPCGGSVRYTLDERDEKGQAMARCDKCGQNAVVTWWEDKMFDDPELQKILDADGVCRLVHRNWGDVITRATVRKWVQRGIIEPTSTEDGKPSTFERDAVVYAIDRWKRREEIGS